MKKWETPDLWVLGAEKTAAGGGGRNGDGVFYQVGKDILIGTSGTEPLDYPVVP